MFKKCVLLLFILGQIEADFGGAPKNRMCPYPRFNHGRFRVRQKSKLIKFICFPGFELVGNKYATCRDGEWDEPLPVCVKPGCEMVQIENGIQWKLRNGAWVVFFCLPGYNMVGSSAIYCDGRKWNGTAPTCVNTAAPSKLSCDFEDPDLCGWTQDELHDFDWKRLNRKTPSSFLMTGPSFDHTFGEGGTGYYMYIESTARLENSTARLISPIYDSALTRNGCFSFFYHMFGKTTGGLRVYQKPENYPLQFLVQLSDAERQKYILFEKWGNQGDFWYRDVSKLSNFSDNFQIIIEGIRGSSFMSDIAIDDVAILQGDNCTVVNNTASTPVVFIPDSCNGRCDLYGESTRMIHINLASDVCGCSVDCLVRSNCCPDFFDVCVFGNGTTTADDNPSTPVELPQTQKLVASTTTSTVATTIPSTISSTTTKIVPTTKLITTTTISATAVKPTTKKIPTLVFKTTMPIYNATGKIRKDKTNKPVVVKPVTTASTAKTTTVVATKVVTTTPVPFKTSTYDSKMKATKKPEVVEVKKLDANETGSTSSGLKTSIITVTALLCCAGAVWLAAAARGARGRAALARLRGRTRRDPEVRYLNADVDDD